MLYPLSYERNLTFEVYRRDLCTKTFTQKRGLKIEPNL